MVEAIRESAADASSASSVVSSKADEHECMVGTNAGSAGTSAPSDSALAGLSVRAMVPFSVISFLPQTAFGNLTGSPDECHRSAILRLGVDG